MASFDGAQRRESDCEAVVLDAPLGHGSHVTGAFWVRYHAVIGQIEQRHHVERIVGVLEQLQATAEH